MSNSYLVDYGLYNDTVMRLQEQAFAIWTQKVLTARSPSLERNALREQTNLTRVLTHSLRLTKEEDIKNIINDFRTHLRPDGILLPQPIRKGVWKIVNFILRSFVPTEKKGDSVIESEGTVRSGQGI